MSNDVIDMTVLVDRLRSAAHELALVVTAARKGVDIIALEDYYIREEINAQLCIVDLEVVQKGQ